MQKQDERKSLAPKGCRILSLANNGKPKYFDAMNNFMFPFQNRVALKKFALRIVWHGSNDCY